MTTNLFINYYTDKNEARQTELDHCVLENIKVFDCVVVIADPEDFEKFDKLTNYSGKTVPVITFDRPTYSDFFELTKCANSDNLNVISNLDIIFPEETLTKAKEYFKSEALTCLALTRWDIKDDGRIEFLMRPDSQDCWFFKGEVTGVRDLNYGLGTAGCDNALAYELEVAGYQVKNPSLSLRTIHNHVTGVLNYEPLNTVPAPYRTLNPSE